MFFLDFERPIEQLSAQIAQLKQMDAQEGTEASKALTDLEHKLMEAKKKVYSQLSRWQKVQLSRHPNRPYTLDYLGQMCERFMELHGDRNFGDDKAIIGGFGTINQRTVLFIGHQKGRDTKSRQYRNFGMANPEGYRKALRLMKLAEKFDRPIVCLIDTPGAYPGIEAEQRGQAEAIARNLLEMAQLRVPILCIVIGEGASGGALGIGVGNRVLMLENTWYSVISPESCSSILWGDWTEKEKAAEQLQLTATDMQRFGLIDEIIPEPLGGAHYDPMGMATILKQHIEHHLTELTQLQPDQLVTKRINKFANMGEYELGVRA